MIKEWADRYDFLGEVKGGTIRINPTYRLVITSNHSLKNVLRIERILLLSCEDLKYGIKTHPTPRLKRGVLSGNLIFHFSPFRENQNLKIELKKT